MTKHFKPMLSAKYESFKGPYLASTKLDGIRCLYQGGLVSRTLKPFPNHHLNELFNNPELEGLDGELIVGPPNDPLSYKRTMEVVMSKDKPIDGIGFYVFDSFTLPQTFFRDRLKVAATTIEGLDLPIQMVEHALVSTKEELLSYEEKVLAAGYEGVMLRDPEGFFKFGRSTVKENTLLKLKRFEDREAVVVEVIEEMANNNEATIDALGHTKRATCKGNKAPKGVMGALVCKDDLFEFTFEIGTGFTAVERKQLWDDQPIGRTVKYKYFPHGVKDRPRHPVFLGFRGETDI